MIPLKNLFKPKILKSTRENHRLSRERSPASLRFGPSLTLSLHAHLRLDRISDVALLVRQLVQPLLVGRRRPFLAAIDNLRVQRDRTHPRNPALILARHAYGLVAVAIHLEPLPGRQI